MEMWKKNSPLVVRLGKTFVGVRSLAHVPKGCRWVLLGDKINMFREQNLKNALSLGIKNFVSLTYIPKFSSLLFYMTKKTHKNQRHLKSVVTPMPCTHLETLDRPFQRSWSDWRERWRDHPSRWSNHRSTRWRWRFREDWRERSFATSDAKKGTR